MKIQVQSPQAPPDPQPVPLERMALSAAGCTAGVERAFGEQYGVYSVGQLLRWILHHELTEVRGVGQKTSEKIMHRIEELRRTRGALERTKRASSSS